MITLITNLTLRNPFCLSIVIVFSDIESKHLNSISITGTLWTFFSINHKIITVYGTLQQTIYVFLELAIYKRFATTLAGGIGAHV